MFVLEMNRNVLNVVWTHKKCNQNVDDVFDLIVHYVRIMNHPKAPEFVDFEKVKLVDMDETFFSIDLKTMNVENRMMKTVSMTKTTKKKYWMTGRL